MTYHLAISNRFERQLKRFYRKNPELRERVQETLRDLETDPFQPHLRLHPLHGNLEGYHAARIDYSNRIVMTLWLDERVIRLVAIGTHDEVYR